MVIISGYSIILLIVLDVYFINSYITVLGINILLLIIIYY